MLTRLFPAVLLASLGVSLAHADTLWIGSQGTGAIPYTGCKVLRVEASRIFFRNKEGNDSSRDLAQVQRMELDDEPALNAAEQAFAAQQFDKATDEYLRAQRGTTRSWLKQWTSVRLLTSANKAGRFDAAASAYADLVQTDLKLAQDNRPQIDEANPPKPGVIDASLSEIDKALAKTGLTPDQKQALLQLHLELARAKNDAPRAAKILEQLLATGGNASDPAAQKALADVRLSQAQVAADAKDFPKALSLIEQNKTSFTEPRQQAEALYIIARAKDADAHAAGKKPDPEKLKDAALAYMRIVANFRDIPSAASRVPASLLRTAQLMEEAGAPDDARTIYKDLAEGTDATVKEPARQGLERLKSK